MANDSRLLLPPQPPQGISSRIGNIHCERGYEGDIAEAVPGWLQPVGCIKPLEAAAR